MIYCTRIREWNAQAVPAFLCVSSSLEGMTRTAPPTLMLSLDGRSATYSESKGRESSRVKERQGGEVGGGEIIQRKIETQNEIE